MLHPEEDRVFERLILGSQDKAKGPWIVKALLGKNTLTEMMAQLSVSRHDRQEIIHTNHSALHYVLVKQLSSALWRLAFSL